MPLEVSVEDDTCLSVLGCESSEVSNDRSTQSASGALGFNGETATRLNGHILLEVLQQQIEKSQTCYIINKMPTSEKPLFFFVFCSLPPTVNTC